MFEFSDIFSIVITLIFAGVLALLGVALFFFGFKLLRRSISGKNTPKTFMFIDGESANGNQAVPPEVTSAFQTMNDAFKTMNEAFQGNAKPQFVAVTCPNCGATCQIPQSGGKCEYCESFLNAQ